MKKKRALAASRMPDSYDIEKKQGGYVIRDPAQTPSSIVFHSGTDESSEMLRITREGFYVRGIKVEQDEKEAQRVYDAFHEWMVWSAISRQY